jgi:Lrp/AsnC family transcriptional regulator for asnA, asnC and gidA
MELDEIDRKILSHLEKDSRVSYTTLAKKLDISDVAIKKRIDKLIENGIIERFSISIDNKKLGMPLKAFILIKSLPSEAAQISDELKKMRNVNRIFSTLGPYDVVIELSCKDIDELKSLTDENIGNLRGVTDIRTLVVV